MKKKLLIVLVVLLLAILFFVSKGIGIYNNIVSLEENVKTAFAQIENVYQRRYDLIPNLVATVQGEADFEKSTLTEVIDARSRLGGTIKLDENMLNDETLMKRFQENQATLGGALGRLMMVTENYPNLKSNQSFQELRVQLEGAENRIAVERKRYNEVVNAHNVFIRKFPNNLIAGFAGASPKVLFSADVNASVAPKVEFK